MKAIKNNRKSLEGKRPTFFLTGLVLVLLAVYGLLNLRFAYEKNPGAACPKTDNFPLEAKAFVIPKNKPQQEEKKKKEVKEETKKILSQDFTIIENQGPDIEEPEDEPLEVIDAVPGEEFTMEVIMDALDKKPVFPGCEGILDKNQQFDCFVEQVRNFVAKNMKTCQGAYGVIPDNLIVSFVITSQGNIGEIQVVRGLEDCNKRNAAEVIKNLPQMQPGLYMGKPVKTRFTLPINIRQN